MRFLYLTLLTLLSTSLFAQTQYSDSIWHDGMFRSYIVHLPPAYNSSTLFPLEIVLHGGGTGGAQKIINEHQFEEVADTANYIAVFPNGYENSWADGRGTTDADKDGIDDVSFLNTLIDTLSHKLSFNTNKVYLCGGSNGGFMTQRMACEGSEKIAAFASIISNMSDSLKAICIPEQEINMLVMSSTNDQWVPYEGGVMGGLSAGGSIIGVDATIDFWLNNNKSANTPDSTTLPNISTKDNGVVDVFTYPIGTNKSEVILYRVNGAGHTVPGQLPKWNQIPLLGYVNRDIDGAQEVWEFFNRHSLLERTLTNRNIDQVKFSVFPNPVKEILYVEAPSNVKLYHFVIRDQMGKVITKSSSHNLEVNTSKYKSGIYFITLMDDQEKILSTQSFVKQD